MNISDLEKFLVIAERQNLQIAAGELDSSPSVLSKSLKRLETALSITLFDRAGKYLRLNPAGELFRNRAASLVSLAKQTQSELAGITAQHCFTVAGPSILQFRWASVINRFLKKRHPNAIVRFDSVFERQALEKVTNGTADMCLITTRIASQLDRGLYAHDLGEVTMQVAVSATHPLMKDRHERRIDLPVASVLQHPFAVPHISPFCSESKGVDSDGWRNDIFPRKLQMIVNDYGVLSQLVRSGQAIAYLPDYWVREWNLSCINITDCPYQCVEKLMLVSRQKDLIDNFVSQ